MARRRAVYAKEECEKADILKGADLTRQQAARCDSKERQKEDILR